jgi:hypothetical protein
VGGHGRGDRGLALARVDQRARRSTGQIEALSTERQDSGVGSSMRPVELTSRRLRDFVAAFVDLEALPRVLW